MNRTVYLGCYDAVNYLPEQVVKRDELVVQAIRLSGKRKNRVDFY
jgi:hypothetical protein